MLIWLQTPVLTHFIVCDRFPDVPEVFRDGFWSQKVERKVEQPIVLSKPVWTRNSTRNPPKCHSDWDWFVQCHRLGCSTVGRFYSLWYFVCISSKQTFNTTDRPRKRSRTSGSSIVSEQTINPISNQKWSWRCRKSPNQLQILNLIAVHMSWDHIQKLWRSVHRALRKVVHKIVTQSLLSSVRDIANVPKWNRKIIRSTPKAYFDCSSYVLRSYPKIMKIASWSSAKSCAQNRHTWMTLFFYCLVDSRSKSAWIGQRAHA